MKTAKKTLKLLVTSALIAAGASPGHADPIYDNWEIISVSPVSGKPWVGSTSAFDWGSWSYSDSMLKNNASATRTWVIPMPMVTQFSNVIDDAHGVWSMTTDILFRANVRAGSSATCIQGVVNSSSGSRLAASGSVCTSSTSNTRLQTPILSSDIFSTAYLNVNVGGGGGRISYSEILSWMYTQ